jgi:hypothetical protein
VLLPRLVRNHFVAIELEDGACGAFARRGVVDGRHAALESQDAGAEGRAVCFALEGRARGAV